MEGFNRAGWKEGGREGEQIEGGKKKEWFKCESVRVEGWRRLSGCAHFPGGSAEQRVG